MAAAQPGERMNGCGNVGFETVNFMLHECRLHSLKKRRLEAQAWQGCILRGTAVAPALPPATVLGSSHHLAPSH